MGRDWEELLDCPRPGQGDGVEGKMGSPLMMCLGAGRQGSGHWISMMSCASLGKYRIPSGLGFLICEMQALMSGYPQVGFTGACPGVDLGPDCTPSFLRCSRSVTG